MRKVIEPQIKFGLIIKALQDNQITLDCYHSDLYHDALYLNKNNPERFIWAVRKTGTRIFVIGGELGLNISSMPSRMFYFDGYTLAEISHNEAVTMVENEGLAGFTL